MEYLNAFWFQEFKNFGDCLNPLVLKFLSGLDVKNCTSDIKGCIVAIGSVLGNLNKIYPDYYIWGSGCMFTYENSVKNLSSLKNIFAVRGPKTRAVLLQAGVKCPEIYGDPGIFAPFIYNDIKKNPIYNYGIILHHNDLDNLDKLKNQFSSKNVLFIRLDQDVKTILQQICQCKKIISSALHGIIAAEAFGIPAVWLEVSDRVEGDGFKFYDYYFGSGRILNDVKKLNWRKTANLDNIPTTKHPTYNVQGLLDAAPFEIKPEIKTKCIDYFKNLH